MNQKVLSVGELPDNSKFHIRYMETWDVPEVLEVWKEIGLYEGTHTIDSFLKIDPKGFFVAVLDHDGKYLIFFDSVPILHGLTNVDPAMKLSAKKVLGLSNRW